MHLAQIDTTASSFVGDFAGKFGFPALLVLVLLFGIYRMQERASSAREAKDKADAEERAAREARDDKREAERRSEREADRVAHVNALAQHTATLNTLGQAVLETGRKVDTLTAAVQQDLRLVKG